MKLYQTPKHFSVVKKKQLLGCTVTAKLRRKFGVEKNCQTKCLQAVRN